MDAIRVEQLVFGYENGHRLLETSLEKKLIQQKEVEILSDASGSGMFTDYISCFPLREDGYYAFAKTWYAHEMERPGCVWTHVLLFRFEDLDYLAGSIDIKDLFARPSVHANLSAIYGEPLMVQKNYIFNHGLYSDYLIYTLFYSGKKALMEIDDSEPYEKELLSILPKFNSKMLMNLSVCTCSLRNRYINNDEFSYQITVTGNAKKLSMEMKDAIIYRKKETIEDFPLWVSYINELFSDNRQEEIYRFCEKYGNYGREFIKDFSKLLYMVKEFSAKYDLYDFLEAMNKLELGNIIKKKTLQLLLVETDEDMLRLFVLESIITRLSLEMQDMHGMFTTKKLKKDAIEKNAKMIYSENNKKQIKSIFSKYIQGELNDTGNKIVECLVSIMNPNDLCSLLDMELNCCIVLVRMDYRFFLCKEIWHKNKNYQLQVLSTIRKGQELPVNKILKCIFESTKENISNEVFDIFQNDYLDFLYDYCKEGHMKYPYQDEIWGHHLALDPKRCIKLLPQIKDGKLLVEIMKSTDSYMITEPVDGEIWISSISNNLDYIMDQYRYNAALFLLPLVLKTRHVPAEIKEMVFGEINSRLEKSEMDYSAWRRMDQILPDVDIQQSWDKCLRLRLAFGK